MVNVLGGGFNDFLFLPGEMIQFDEHIFQMGWFHHQLVKVYILVPWILFRGFSPVSGASLKSQRRSGGGISHRKNHGGRD